MIQGLIFAGLVFLIVTISRKIATRDIPDNFDESLLKDDAEVSSVDNREVGFRDFKHYITVVTFSDGWVYQSTDATEVEKHFFGNDIYVDQDKVNQIIKKAKDEHKRLCEKRKNESDDND